MNPHTEELRLKSRLRFMVTLRLIDGRAISEAEDAIRDRLTVLGLTRELDRKEVAA